MKWFCSGMLLQIRPQIPVQNILKSSTDQNEEINQLNHHFLWAAGFIFLSVVILTFLVVYKYRRQKVIGVPLREASKKLEFATIGIPTLLVIFFLVSSVRTMRHLMPDTAGHAPDVIITGYQWWWSVQYPQAHVVAANEIHLPVGKKLLLKLLSGDVIHDWWVPQFGSKMDMIPARENYLWVTIKQPGAYYGVCSEFCGAQHANMRITVIAQPEAEFDSWLKQNQQITPSDTSVANGAYMFQTRTCGNCHRIAGTPANGTTGPDLTHIGSRGTLLAGMLVNNQENLESWIRDPQKVKPGANMPKFILSDTAIKALTTYLLSLK
jgi:cytochrome c oxidase subunit II